MCGFFCFVFVVVCLFVGQSVFTPKPESFANGFMGFSTGQCKQYFFLFFSKLGFCKCKWVYNAVSTASGLFGLLIRFQLPVNILPDNPISMESRGDDINCI